MWESMTSLPADVLGQKVLSILGCRDIVRLDTALACHTTRARLHPAFPFTTLSWLASSAGSPKIISELQWLISRGIKVALFRVEGCYREVLLLLSSKPNIVRGQITVSCANQASLEEVKDALVQAQMNNGFDFKFFLILDGKIKIHDPAVYNGRLSGLRCSAAAVGTETIRALVYGNLQMDRIQITKATLSELKLVAALGSSMQLVCLDEGNFNDADLAALGPTLVNVRHLQMRYSSFMGVFDTGFITVAKGLRELQKLSLRYIHLSDAAVVALIKHCPKLQSAQLFHGFLTSEAVSALVDAPAPWKSLTIGWRVASAAALSTAVDTGAFKRITHFEIVSMPPEYAPALEDALLHMMALTHFTLSAQGSRVGPPVPAQVLMGLARSPSALTSLSVWVPICGDHERVLTQVFRASPGLTSLSCNVVGAMCSDTLMLQLAEQCRELKDCSISAAATLTDTAITALVCNCQQLDSLLIDHGASISDATLDILSEHCSNLASLYLRGSPRITGPALLHLIQRCSNLTELRIPVTVGTSEEAAEMGRILSARSGFSQDEGVYDNW